MTTAFINGMCHVERLSAAQELFKGISAHDLVPNMVTYAIFGLEPDIVHYNMLIDGLCQVGFLKIARNLFCALITKGLNPNVYIKGLCKEGLPNEAYELFRKMEVNGCLQDSFSYNTMIRGFL
ncbi:Pentatricopeptide repeat - like 10 [Theobroma cacao]|nr:Pentatricopeptide repeat - like 10 [Theobroma cacao]